MCLITGCLRIEHSNVFLQILWTTELRVINIEVTLNQNLYLTEILVMANVKRNSPFLTKNDWNVSIRSNLTQIEIPYFQFITYIEPSFKGEIKTASVITECLGKFLLSCLLLWLLVCFLWITLVKLANNVGALLIFLERLCPLCCWDYHHQVIWNSSQSFIWHIHSRFLI